MAFIDNYDFENLIDEGKRLVIEELGSQLEDWPHPVCLCNDCIVDMAGMALNHLPPRYHCSLLGGLYAADLEDMIYRKKLKKAVAHAIKRVSENPAHD
ncbi:MAG: late competence development ComFB family protein [Spirochaetaceae bacterium]|nr:late competence development ComFB family protein [Spirochaetaceae bacterium]